jgi:hypothetical protein
MIAARLAMISAGDDAVAFNQDSSNSGVRACFSQPSPRFGKGSSHEFFVHAW